MKMPDLIVPFNEDELTIIGEYPGHHPGEPGIPIFKTPIKPYENLKMFLAGERPLWVPSFLEFKMFNPSILADNVARMSVEEADGRTEIDRNPDGMKPPFLKKNPIYNKDYFGIEWEFVPETFGSIVRPGTPKVPDICEWEKYITFPDFSQLDWSGAASKNADFLNDSRAIQMTVFNGFFERLISFVGMEPALVAMIDPDEQEAVHRLFDRLASFYDELFYYMAKWFQPDILWFHDDWGSQRAPLFSLEICREMLVPYLKRAVESAHNYGIGFEFHSCGKNEMLVPAMIEAGVDMWSGQGINDKEMLYKEYGKDIKFGIVPPPMPKNASEQQIWDIVGKLLDTFPVNVYMGMDFGSDPRYYPYIYEASRKQSMRLQQN